MYMGVDLFPNEDQPAHLVQMNGSSLLVFFLMIMACLYLFI